jgi:protein SCO1/2
MRTIVWLLSLVFLAFTLGCQSAPEKHYSLQAEVISVDVPRKLIVVKHGAIPGLMPAMTMTYVVADAKQLENLHPGDKITADLVVSGNKGRLEKIALLSRAGESNPHP